MHNASASNAKIYFSGTSQFDMELNSFFLPRPKNEKKLSWKTLMELNSTPTLERREFIYYRYHLSGLGMLLSNRNALVVSIFHHIKYMNSIGFTSANLLRLLGKCVGVNGAVWNTYVIFQQKQV
jgi:hypothetical protein